MKKNTSVAFTGGGSGGHVFPGIAIIKELRQKKNLDIYWLGSKRGPEKEIVEAENISYFAISTGKLRRYFSLKNCADVFRILSGIFEARKKLREISAGCLVSLGSFASFPAVLAAWTLGIPVLSVIIDLSFSLAAKLNERFSSLLCFSYQSTLAAYKGRKKTIYSGFPVRRQILEGDARLAEKTYGIKQSEKLLFCVGGSLGAQQLNDLVKKISASLDSNVVLIHQTGKQSSTAVPGPNMNAIVNRKEAGSSKKKQYIFQEFFGKEYAHILARADLVLGRAGTGVLWECLTQSVPAVVVPLSRKGSRGDQIENAKYFAKHELVINAGSSPSPRELCALLKSVLRNPLYAKKLREKTTAFLPKLNSAEIIAKHILAFFQYNTSKEN